MLKENGVPVSSVDRYANRRCDGPSSEQAHQRLAALGITLSHIVATAMLLSACTISELEYCARFEP